MSIQATGMRAYSEAIQHFSKISGSLQQGSAVGGQTLFSRTLDQSLARSQVDTGENFGAQVDKMQFPGKASTPVMPENSFTGTLKDSLNKVSQLQNVKDKAVDDFASGRTQNVQELMNSMQGFIEEQQQLEDGDPSLSNFLENIALSADTQKDKEDDNTDKVSLMTIHLSKGLEFPIVHLVGLEENLFPSFMSSSTREELEEERRLFYVALTRAEKQAFFTYAVSRFQWGKITDAEPSRFLSEVDSQYLEFINPAIESRFVNHSGLKSNIFDDGPSEPRFFKKVEPKKTLKRDVDAGEAKQPPQNLKPVATAKIINPSGQSSQDIEVGDKVRHDRFGVGEVTFLDGTDPQNIKAKVVFQHEGEKNLILKFAKLTKI